MSYAIVTMFGIPLGATDSFWDPVKVTTDTEKFKYTQVDLWDCPLCAEDRTRCFKLECCGNRMCDVCTTKWFGKESVKCPYCRKDIR